MATITTAKSDGGLDVRPPPQEILPAPQRPLPPLAQPEARPPAAGPLPALAKALAAARDRCKSAEKDGTNTFHRYKYATAEEVISTACEALKGSGLAIIPTGEELTAIGSTWALNRLLILAHESGEFLPLTVRGWPVVPDKGRPLDKAFAAALTSSLAYKLRDLLQMPRGEEDGGVDARDDRHAEPAPPPTPARQAPQAPAPEPTRAPDPEARVGNRALQSALRWEEQAVREGLCREGELVAYLEERLGGEWVKAPQDDLRRAAKEFGDPRREALVRRLREQHGPDGNQDIPW